MGEVDRLTAEVATIARQSLREVAAVSRAAHRASARRPGDPATAGCRGWPASSTRPSRSPGGCCGRPSSGLPATAASRTGWCRWLIRMPGRSARASRNTRPSSATPCCWPRTSAALSPTTCFPRATRPTPHNCSRPCVQWPPCGAGRQPPWSPTAALGSPPTTAPWSSSACGASGCSAPARPAGPSRSRRQLERTRAFKRLRNWRVGIEARISHLKRSFGLRRTRLRRLPGAQTWVGLGVFAYNLQRMTVVG